MWRQKLQSLRSSHPFDLSKITRGVEKEHLRVNFSSQIAQTAHPKMLGSALTNAYVTTDFSESLLEMVTPPVQGLQNLTQQLNTINSFVYKSLRDEYLWPLSMPPQITNPDDIKIANYGHSNIAQMKQVYRQGLAWRYGKNMQTIAGIHYNFSVPDEFFIAMQKLTGDSSALVDFRSVIYMRAVRNFHCHAMLLPYLFGASPFCASSSVPNDPPAYLKAVDEHTFVGEYATSLRMSDLGYQNDSQSKLDICYDDHKSYAKSLLKATATSYPPFTKIGVKVDGHYRQLNDSILQIENEFYSFIRPKQIAQSGERPATALCRRGVAYLEVRLLDLNPLQPLGLDIETMAFMDVFILYCLLLECESICRQTCQMARENFLKVATMGRKPGLILQMKAGEMKFSDWAKALLQELKEIAQWLDQETTDSVFEAAVDAQLAKLDDVNLTPAAQMLNYMKKEALTYQDFCFLQAEAQAGHALRDDVDSELLKTLKNEAQQSQARWQQIEAAPTVGFDDFLKDYFSSC